MITWVGWFMARSGTGFMSVGPAERHHSCQELRGRDAWTVLDDAVALLTHWPVVLLVTVLLLVAFRRAIRHESTFLRHERRRSPRRD